MLLITVTDWRHKVGLLIRLLLFLVLVGLIVPQLYRLLYGHNASFKGYLQEDRSPGLRVEQKAAGPRPIPPRDQSAPFLQQLQQYYLGKSLPPGS